VDGADWDDCHEFLRKLSALGNGKGQFRLPTEAEWEWACRAGTKTRFCCGDDEARLGEYAWYKANSSPPRPVGEKLPNAWGLYDCHGNVCEWCSDELGRYSSNPWPGNFRWMRDPKGPTSGQGVRRVRRGGAWHDAPAFCRSAERSSRTRGILTGWGSSADFGLRVVVAVTGP
jgi:formylglycine-generating enzyme required for sulfatase activity